MCCLQHGKLLVPGGAVYCKEREAAEEWRPGVAAPDHVLRWNRSMSMQEPAECEDSAPTDATFTEHFEPLDQGGKRYVRCEGCGRELLVDLGGREQLPHRDRCSNA